MESVTILFIEPNSFIAFDEANQAVKFWRRWESVAAPKEISEKFEQLKKMWIADTAMLSNPRLKYENKNYKEIIKLDSFILPYIIQDLTENNNDWFFALNQITNENPIKEEHQGYYDLMKQDWLDWAEQNMVNQYASNDFRYVG